MIVVRLLMAYTKSLTVCLFVFYVQYFFIITIVLLSDCSYSFLASRPEGRGGRSSNSHMQLAPSPPPSKILDLPLLSIVKICLPVLLCSFN